MNLKERAAQLRKLEKQFPGRLRKIAKDGTLRAVEAVTEATPPTGGDLKGTNTRTGAMKQSWATSSEIEPQKRGDDYVNYLANNEDYSSYVNDGHRMDKHFVPGLIINPYSGMLEYNQGKQGGIVVGTKTAYVPGLHMVDKGKEAYEKTVREGLENFVKEVGK